jgi:hypothetical protein
LEIRDRRRHRKTVQRLDLLPLYRARFFGHNFDLSGVLDVGFLPGETRLARAA